MRANINLGKFSKVEQVKEPTEQRQPWMWLLNRLWRFEFCPVWPRITWCILMSSVIHVVYQMKHQAAYYLQSLASLFWKPHISSCQMLFLSQLTSYQNIAWIIINNTALLLGLSHTSRLWICITKGSIGLRMFFNISSLCLFKLSPLSFIGLSILLDLIQ